MPPITLPGLPLGKEFEEYNSALFQTSSYYVERHIIERDVEEVLELDIVITDYRQSPPDIRLIEVKSGDWGFSDLFKLRGWMDYLGFAHSIFIVNRGKDNFSFLQDRGTKLDIDIIAISDLDEAEEKLRAYVPPGAITKLDVGIWRFSYWVERNLMKRLNEKKKAHPSEKRYRALEDYYFKVNSGIFFTQNIIERLSELYSAFQEYPLISAKCAHEMLGNDFDEDHESLPTDVLTETFYAPKYNDIQISTFVEHRARLAILKNAIDFKLYKDAGDEPRTRDNSFKILGLELSRFDLLPSSFKRGLEIICEHEHCSKYPIFWQWFMWVFGGFILKDRKEDEFRLLSQKTGIPEDNIQMALDSYQLLFPTSGGWFRDLSPNSHIEVMKLFPVPFMGIGANYRRLAYTTSQDYKDLEPGGQYTLADLKKWNNIVVEVLAKG